MSLNIVQQDIDKWLNGEDAAFRRVFNAFYARLFQTCFKTVKLREESEEMVMNVFFNIWHNRQTLVDVENFEGYLFRSLRNQISDYRRKKILLTQSIDETPLGNLGVVQHPETSFKELEEAYHQALGKLSDRQREVFLMSRELGMSQKKIAQIENISASTVNNHITTATKIIRNELSQYSETLTFYLCINFVLC